MKMDTLMDTFGPQDLIAGVQSQLDDLAGRSLLRRRRHADSPTAPRQIVELRLDVGDEGMGRLRTHDAITSSNTLRVRAASRAVSSSFSTYGGIR